MKPPLAVMLTGTPTIKVFASERDVALDVIEQVVRQVSIGDLDEFAAAVRSRDVDRLDVARDEIGDVYLKLATLTLDEAEQFAHTILATIRAARAEVSA